MVFEDDKAIAINALIEAVEAIEFELGITPSGVYADVRVRLDILEARINDPLDAAPNVTNPFIIGNDGITISTGVGIPTENRVAGSLFLRTDGYVNEGLYARRNDSQWHKVSIEDSQFSKIILNGSSSAGAVINLLTQSDGYIIMEDGKSYDIQIRTLINNTTGAPTCARFILDILAHQEGGILIIDSTNTTLSTGNGTSWTISLPTPSDNKLQLIVDAFGSDDRRAIATVEWRELSRL